MPTNSDFESKLSTFNSKTLNSQRSIILVRLSYLPLRSWRKEWFYNAKNFYREDAKFAKKHNTSPAFLSSLALIAERMVFKAKNIHRKDAKFAKKHNTSPAFLSSFAVLASSR